MIDAFGCSRRSSGLVAAFVAAAISIRWMVAYLQRHDLSMFGWYRIVIAVIVGDRRAHQHDLTAPRPTRRW